MNTNTETLQQKLEDLEAGKPIGACLSELEESEKELLQLAAAMRTFVPPARSPSIVSEQRRRLRQMDRVNKPARRGVPWLAPAMAVTILVLSGCLALGVLGVGGWAIARLDQPGSGSAQVQETRGILELQAQDGSWRPVGEKARLASGARVRTGALSGAQLSLQDGSRLQLGPETEITLAQMDRFLLGRRVVQIIQWRGETSHAVQPGQKAGSRYEVRTPTAILFAMGTEFTVEVQSNLLTQIYVSSGRVDVTGAQATVSLTPGQTSSIAVGQPPAGPAYRVSGEGILTISEDGWSVAGATVAVDATTGLTGNPQAGDLVSFVGRQLPDGSLSIERLSRLAHPASNPFTMSGEMEEIASTALVVSGQYIRIHPQTGLAAETESGKAVIVDGVLAPDGAWLANHVYTAATGRPFHFAGVVQSNGGSAWTVSGVEILVDENTSLDPAIRPGDVAEVVGWIQGNGDWLAGGIRPSQRAEAQFDFVGMVDNVDPWVVSGVAVRTAAWTIVESGVRPGDLARVQGSVLEDGAWTAASLTLVGETAEGVTLELTGIVNSTDPWVISGIQFVVDASTQSSGEIATGDLVQVYATLQSNGVWHAEAISLVAPGGLGCVTFASVVTAMEDDQISLQNGMIIDLDDEGAIDGVIEIGSVILVTRCMDAAGVVTIPLIQVLSGPPAEPTLTPTPTPTNTPAPGDVILPNCYKITFLGFTGHGDGTSTWRYFVEELSCAQDLSNWMLELPACASVVSASPSPWEVVHPDPNFHLNGIKWETGTGFQRGEFSVILAGELTSGAVQVGAKGPDVAIGWIAGPACYIPTTPTLTPTITLTPSPTVATTTAPTPTITSTTTATATALPTLTATPVPPPTSPPPPPPNPGAIYVTDNDQTLTFTCNGNAVVVNGNSNTVTLLGACSSITVRGNNNQVFWQSGSPVITDTGNNNTITQR